MTAEGTSALRVVDRTQCFLLGAVGFWGAVALVGIAGPMDGGLRLVVALGALGILATARALQERMIQSLPVLLCAAVVICTVPTPATILVYALAAGWFLGRRGAGLGGCLLLVAIVSQMTIPGQYAERVGIPAATSLGRMVSGKDVIFGPSAAGLPVALWAGLCVAVGAWRSRDRAAAAALAIYFMALVLQWRGTALLHGTFATFASHRHSPQLFDNVLFLAASCSLVVGLAWSRGQDARIKCPTAPFRALRIAGLAVGLLAVGPLGAWRWIGQPDRHVTFLNKGGFDWERPRLGEKYTGMFGLLPVYLRASGWNVSVLNIDELHELAESDTQVLVVINCYHAWANAEREAVERFVKRGGSLLVLGDHTNVFGLMDGLNTLLGPLGIEFRFDSALKSDVTWGAVCVWDPWPLGLWCDPDELGWGVGATLSVQAPARSVLRARYGYGDVGVTTNVGGAFLGDYEYEAGETLGDVDLVASRGLGKGIVLVYGDTSTFQNGNMGHVFRPHVLPLMERLARPTVSWAGNAWQALLAGAALVVSLRSVIHRRGEGMTRFLEAVAVGLIVSHTAASSATGAIYNAGQVPQMILDYSHFPDVGHYRAGWNVPAPLALAAHRSGMLVDTCWDSSDWSNLGRQDTLVLIGPQRKLAPRAAERLLAFMRSGGTVIVAASGDAYPRLHPLLSKLGVMIAPEILGTFPKSADQRVSQPRFLSVSPLLISDGVEYDVLYRNGETLLSGAVRVGEGHLVVVGDTRMCSLDNVEGDWGLWPGNVRFLVDVLTTYCHGTVAESGDVLPKPEAPE